MSITGYLEGINFRENLFSRIDKLADFFMIILKKDTGDRSFEILCYAC